MTIHDVKNTSYFSEAEYNENKVTRKREAMVEVLHGASVEQPHLSRRLLAVIRRKHHARALAQPDNDEKSIVCQIIITKVQIRWQKTATDADADK